MEYLQRLNPSEWEQVPPLTKLYQDLPTTLRCSPHKNNTDFRRKTPKQITKNPYIGYNTPNLTTFIVIDLDYDGSIFAYYDNNVPRPQFVLKNPVNGHCQYLYRLKDPVSFFKSSRNSPIRLLNAVETALNIALGGDMAFAGYLAKNALNGAHEVYFTGSEPYTLNELADYLDLSNLNDLQNHHADNDDCYGRNNAIFNIVRHLAYKIAFKCTYSQLYEQCLVWCQQTNARYSPQLPYNELKSISKSIAGYCTSDKYRRSLSELQARKGAKGGKAKGKAYDDKRQQAKELHKQGVNNTQIARKIGVARLTVIRWLKN